MQRIYVCVLTPESYAAQEAYRQVTPDTVCPMCGWAGALHRHGTYERFITGLMGDVLTILIARFLCAACRLTVSYLPQFALSYRLVAARTVQAWFEGETERRDVLVWRSVLQGYRRRARAFAPEVIRALGWGLGLPPPSASGLWPWLKGACGGLQSATRQLVTCFKITLFNRYQCHQPARL